MRLQPLNRFGRWGVFQQPAKGQLDQQVAVETSKTIKWVTPRVVKRITSTHLLRRRAKNTKLSENSTRLA